MQAYRALEASFARLGALGDAAGILGWDAQTLMPEGAAAGRAEQLATLKGLAHEILTSTAVADRLAEAEARSEGLGEWERANLREMRRAYAEAAILPRDLVEANARAASRAEMTWREARRASDFAMLLPDLSEVLALQVETGRIRGEAEGLSAYDALLDGYDPGLRQATIDPLFDALGASLPGLIEAAMSHQAREPAPEPLPGPFPVEVQARIGRELMGALGFDFGRGRLDVSLHPFCGGACDDVRITTRYDEGDAGGALMGVLHETGHALYEQGLPPAWRHQPVGRARGMILHESQSLLVEMQACRSRAFLAYLAPTLARHFGGEGTAWEADNLRRLYTRVAPGLIRVDADEVTYPAHILVRYDLERALVGGELALRDLPEAFTAGMRERLGLTVPDDRRGCLQDIHWPGGAFGYFPTYTLGAMAAAQLFSTACAQVPEIPGRLAVGQFAPLRDWLRRNVHAKASLRGTDETIEEATGLPLSAEAFDRHIRRRYLGEA